MNNKRVNTCISSKYLHSYIIHSMHTNQNFYFGCDCLTTLICIYVIVLSFFKACNKYKLSEISIK